MKKYFVIIVFSLLWGCSDEAVPVHTGYVEAEYFYIAAPEAGWITELNVELGSEVKPHMVVAKLDNDYQLLNQQQSAATVAKAQAQLKNRQLGARAEEIAVLQSQLKEKRQYQALANLEYQRLVKLQQQHLTTDAEVDKAKYNQQALAAVIETLSAQIKVAQLADRENLIASAKNDWQVAQSALQIADWQLQQRVITARNQGIVDQIFYRQGEFINRGQPMVSVLLPDTKKVRFYLEQAQLSKAKLGLPIKVKSDGDPQAMTANISFIAKHSEFTPPVLYAKDSRDSQVFLIEATFTEPVKLNKGQPVDVYFNE